MDYKKYNDYELIYMVRENDDAYLKVLYDKYYPMIRSIAYHYYQAYPNYGYELDDFIQEGFLSFQKALNQFNEEKDVLFYTFACVCIHRGFISFCRKISFSNKNIPFMNSVSIEEISIEDKKSDIDTIFSTYEFEKVCNQILFELPDDLGCLFELRYNGFNYREIGILLDIPRSTVDFRFRKIRKYINHFFDLNIPKGQ